MLYDNNDDSQYVVVVVSYTWINTYWVQIFILPRSSLDQSVFLRHLLYLTSQDCYENEEEEIVMHASPKPLTEGRDRNKINLKTTHKPTASKNSLLKESLLQFLPEKSQINCERGSCSILT